MKYLFTYLALSVFFLLGNPSNGPSQNVLAQTDVETRIEKPVEKAIRIRQKTQESETQWRGEKEKMMALFESLEKEFKTLEAEKEKQVQANLALKTRIDQKAVQLSDMEQIALQTAPFLGQVMERVRSLVERDLPFLPGERQKRILNLESMMADPEIPVSERFRKVMEALLVEAEYGQTVEVYQETIDLSGQMTLVNLFRLGRVSLFYQTLDKKQCGFYHTAQKVWVPLGEEYLGEIQAAIDMGSKRRPVEILDLPLGRMVKK